MVSRHVLVLSLTLAAFASTTARADEGIALEVYTGTRSADAGRLVSPVLDELARDKITSGDTVGRLVAGISTPSHTDAGMPSDFAQQSDAGVRLYAEGRFTDAIQKLVQLIDVAQHNSGAFANDPKLDVPLQNALIALALAYSHNGDQGAMHATFAEMIRSFPNGQVSRTQFGPSAALSFEESRKLLATQGLGKLTVHATSGVVFVDETYRGSGNTTTLEVPPGDYRVLVIANGLPSRTHNVRVTASKESTVTVDAAFDQAIHTGNWTGFEFANAAAREAHEGEYAAKMARDLGEKSVALVGIDQLKAGSVIVASLISLETGKLIKGATVAVSPDPSRDRLKALAHYIIGEAATAGIDVIDVSKQPAHLAPVSDGTVATGTTTTTTQPDLGVSTSTTVETRWGGWRWMSLGTTVALAGAGATLFALNGKCKGTPPPMGRTCNDVYDNSPYDKYTLIGSVPFAVLTIYLFATQTKTVDARTAALVPVDHGAVATYAFTW